MPVVRMPDGANVSFPDDMPPDQIKGLILKKFPQLAQGAPPNSSGSPDDRSSTQAPPLDPQTRYDLALQQVRRNEYPQMSDAGFADYAKSFLGPASIQGIAQNGQLGNWGSELGSAIGAVGNQARQMVGGGGPGYGQAYSDLDTLEHARQDYGRQLAGPNAQLADVVGAVSALGPSRAAGGAIQSAASASQPLWKLGAKSAAAGTVLGAIEGAGATPSNRGAGAAAGAGTGFLTGWAGPYIGAGANKLVTALTNPSEVTSLASKMAADRIDPATVGRTLSDMGPAAVVGDLGPNLQGKTAALATQPGEAQSTIVDALRTRQEGANSRIQNSVEDTLGPAPVPSQFAAENKQARDALSPEYKSVLREKAFSDNYLHDATPIISTIDDRIPEVVGDTRAQLQRVRSMLIDPTTGKPTQDPGIVLAVRKELDGMINSPGVNSTTAGELKTLRKAIDSDLGANVPGLKNVDAKYAELAKQSDAFDTGTTLLGTGKEAVHPADLANMIVQGSSGQGFARGQGLVSEINRIIGTKANDRVALKNILLGEGSWNRDKLALQFGADKADELVKLFKNEGVMARTENLALDNSKTAAVTAAQGETNAANKAPGFVESALNIKPGSAAKALLGNLTGNTAADLASASNAKLAKILVSNGLPPELANRVASINNNKMRGAAIGSLLARGSTPLLISPTEAAVGQMSGVR